MAFKQKKRVKNARNKYLKSYTDIGKKRVLLLGAKAEKTIQIMPKTPEVAGSESMLESLPMDLLVKIMCHLHHDQLRAVFHVSQCIRTAVLKAREMYFNYTTPSRSRLEMLVLTFSDGDGEGVVIATPRAPKAPKHGPRPARLHSIDFKECAVALFQEFAFSSKT